MKCSEKATSPNNQKRGETSVESGRLHIEGRLNEEPRLQRKHKDENEANQNKHNTREIRHYICKPNARRIQAHAFCGYSQQGQSIQHEPAGFGLFSSWSFPSRSVIRLHAVVQLWLSLQRSVSPRNIPPLVLLFCAISPHLGCSRPLIGVDAESSEIVQEITHPLFFLAHHTARAPPPILRTSRTSAVSFPPCAPQVPQTRPASCVKSPRCCHFPSR